MNNIENGQSAAEQGYMIKDIPGFEGLYACDTKGQIYSYRSKINTLFKIKTHYAISSYACGLFNKS